MLKIPVHPRAAPPSVGTAGRAGAATPPCETRYARPANDVNCSQCGMFTAIRRSRHPVRAGQGFTLIEVIIALAVLALLAAVALPNFRDALLRSRRADAMQALQSIEHAQERFRANHPRYASTLADLSMPASSPAGHYALSMDETSDTGYRVVAEATGRQASDERCARMWVRWQSGNVLLASDCRGCAPSESDLHRCWAR